jgi:hypothetical protein
MEMHELQQAWNGLDQRLERQDRRLREVRQTQGLDATRSRLRLVTVGQLVQLACSAVIVLFAGGYWFDHLDQPHLVVCGVAIHLSGLALLVTSALQLTRLASLDYHQPVLELQRQLLALRRLRIRSERGLLICGFVVWVPLLLMAANAVGLDLWQTHRASVWWNLGAGVALGGLVAWLTQRYRAAFERDAAGRSLTEAERELAELTRTDVAGDGPAGTP